MEKIEDIVEAVKFFPSRPGKVVIRLLRHPDPVLSLYTESDPLTYGDVEMSFEGIKADSHDQLMRMLLQLPRGKALYVIAYPRPELQGWVTKAEFTSCELSDDAPLVAPGGVELMAPSSGSHWNLPSQSGSRLVKKGPRAIPPDDPDSIHGTGTTK